MAALRPGDEAAVAVAVRSITVRPMRNRRQKRVEARVFDATGPMVAVWFNQPWIARDLPPGAEVLLYGQARDRNQFWVKEYEVLGSGGVPAPAIGRVPMYPASQGISPAQLRKLVWDDLDLMKRHVVEPLPPALRATERLPDRPAALVGAHFPDDEDEEKGARERLALEELLLLQLAVAGRRRARREGRRAAALDATGELVDPWLRSLPFELTGDQRRARERIDADLAADRPMQRLLMGEVGAARR